MYRPTLISKHKTHLPEKALQRETESKTSPVWPLNLWWNGERRERCNKIAKSYWQIPSQSARWQRRYPCWWNTRSVALKSWLISKGGKEAEEEQTVSRRMDVVLWGPWWVVLGGRHWGLSCKNRYMGVKIWACRTCHNTPLHSFTLLYTSALLHSSLLKDMGMRDMSVLHCFTVSFLKRWECGTCHNALLHSSTLLHSSLLKDMGKWNMSQYTASQFSSGRYGHAEHVSSCLWIRHICITKVSKLLENMGMWYMSRYTASQFPF